MTSNKKSNISKKILTCDMTINGDFNSSDNYAPCGKIAKYKSPEKIFDRIYNLCGIHANSLNKFYKKNERNLKCIEIKE